MTDDPRSHVLDQRSEAAYLDSLAGQVMELLEKEESQGDEPLLLDLFKDAEKRVTTASYAGAAYWCLHRVARHRGFRLALSLAKELGMEGERSGFAIGEAARSSARRNALLAEMKKRLADITDSGVASLLHRGLLRGMGSILMWPEIRSHSQPPDDLDYVQAGIDWLASCPLTDQEKEWVVEGMDHPFQASDSEKFHAFLSQYREVSGEG